MRQMLLATLLIPVIFFSLSPKLSANPGDTTWVQAQNDVQLNYYNDFDANITLPNGSTTYRKIIMVFTLGKYKCPVGTQYCGDWDYTIQNYLMTPTDTFELSRLITPYANASYPRTPWAWKQHYYYDITDFYPVLKNNVTIRLAYHNYSGGFTGNIRFAFIEGTPPRNVTGITHLWNGAFTYGSATDPIENHFGAVNAIAPANTTQAEMKFTVTGHGSDQNYCNEFCSKYYNVLANSSLVEQKTIWKDNCGSNDLYPQSGTWVYNRANWCPGQLIYPNIHKMGSITAGNTLKADVDFQSYSGNGGASFIVSSALFFYGSYNKTLDASLESILSPTNYEGSFRANPICGSPQVVVRNTGATGIQSISFQYAVTGQTPKTYTASGMALAPGKDTTLPLPPLETLFTMAANSLSPFTVTIQQVNGVADDYAINNSIQSYFATAPDWPEAFTVTLKTNNGATETKWRIEDLSGTIIKQQNPTTANTTYTDSIKALPDGCYRLVVTDDGCNGLYWWANPGGGSGWIYVSNSDGNLIHLTNGLPDYPASLSQDFGCGFTQYFRVSVTLPASQLLLSGKTDGAVNHLSWQTSTEINTTLFDVQFAADGNNFTTVSQVTAKGNTSTATTYTADHTPSPTGTLYYYRLKLYYADGSYKYSNTIKLQPVIVGNFSVIINPNPFTSKLILATSSPKQQSATVHLVDIQGRMVYENNITVPFGYGTITLDGLSKLGAGIYMIVIDAEGSKTVKKLVKM